MKDDEKKKLEELDDQTKDKKDLSEEELSSVSGGTMRGNVYITDTTDISDSTRKRI